ncbi:hypothetical protein FDP41_003072 [Naegleria fowleri]|uniref:Uncharacterized protein n=1 Tax=Naegleria fowleri TaxID=5763 RepID=A0A6A5BVG9_NAEFO|nr:uncharacterized protein FDP41_003072 [Naegleria fowleri]KAF0977750.1 hypothetical protein FDP41_003072 [Naegleria fowleri]
MFSYSSSRRLWACGFSLLILLLMMISYSEAHVIWEALTTTTTTTTTTKHSHHQPKVTEVHLHYDRKLPSSESASTHLLALSFSLIAGFSTFIGGFIIACIGKPSDSKIGHMMGFASVFHLIPESIEDIGYIKSAISFILGCIVFMFISKTLLGDTDQEDFILQHATSSSNEIANSENDHDPKKSMKKSKSNSDEEVDSQSEKSDKLKDRSVATNQGRKEDAQKNTAKTTGDSISSTKQQHLNKKRLYHTAIIVTLGLSIHNLPEGMAVYTSTLTQYKLGLMIALAIGLHNVPEGMAVSIAVYAATNSIYQALKYSFLSGLCEPIGAALFGVLIYVGFLPHYLVYYMLAGCGGIMTMICFTELIPTSLQYLSIAFSQNRIFSILHCFLAHLVGMSVIYLCSWLMEQYEH